MTSRTLHRSGCSLTPADLAGSWRRHPQAGYVYLIHLDEPIADHANHYTGSTRTLFRRLLAHAGVNRRDRPARLLTVARERGIDWFVAGLWLAENCRMAEVCMKRTKHANQFCPVCRPQGARVPDRSVPIDPAGLSYPTRLQELLAAYLLTVSE